MEDNDYYPSDEEEDSEVALISLNSDVEVNVLFVNLSPFTVYLMWCDFDGLYVLYRVLKPQDYMPMTTFATHPWIVLDKVTHKRMGIANPTSLAYIPVNAEQDLNEEQEAEIVNIYLPMISLKELCKRLIKLSVPRQFVPQLDIPDNLLDELLLEHSRPWSYIYND